MRAGPWEDATDLYKQIVKQLGCDAWGASALDCMLSKDKNTLLNVSDSYYGNCSLPHKESIVTTQWAPAMDGVFLPQMPVSSTPSSVRRFVRTAVNNRALLEHRLSCWRRGRWRQWRCCWARTRTRGAPSSPTRPRPCQTSTSTHTRHFIDLDHTRVDRLIRIAELSCLLGQVFQHDVRNDIRPADREGVFPQGPHAAAARPDAEPVGARQQRLAAAQRRPGRGRRLRSALPDGHGGADVCPAQPADVPLLL